MKVNEIFYSLQGEGRWSGCPAVFVRLSGCNLRCGFCDTNHSAGEELSEAEIAEAVCRYPSNHVIFTGGEPTLQLTRSLVDLLHLRSKYIHIETNGTTTLTDGLAETLDWITVSPKEAPLKIQRMDELKALFFGAETDMTAYEEIASRYGARHRYLQPCDVKDAAENARILAATIAYIKAHPAWSLSTQLHKLLGFR